MKIRKELWFGFGLMAVILATIVIFTPWGNLTRIAALLPLVNMVARKRNIYLSLWTHLALNTIGMLLSLALIAGQ